VTVGPGITRDLPRPWEPMIGSEHLSHLLRRDRLGGRVIGEELRDALRIARDEFGVRAVRAHGILCDDLGVYREVSGAPVHDFTGVDRVYDELLGLGLSPVAELSYMPAALARDPAKTVFAYGAVVSPPKDWSRWADLIRDLVTHWTERYGLAEVRDHWSFEVWNEPNLGVFWTGTPEEYFRLYDVTAQAVRSVHPGLKVGGPASAASEWVDELLAHLEISGAPLDFVSTHTYGNAPLDLRPVLEQRGRADASIWWTEWGTTPTHFNRVGDTVFAAAFLLRGMRSALGRVAALSHWVASDHFEELGAPGELFHGGFGLLSVGNLRKPRFWALALLARMGPRELAVSVTGDGAWSLVEALAARADDGRITVLVWNAPLDQQGMNGDPRLDRQVRLRVAAGDAARYTVTHYRIDAGHSNIVAVWDQQRGGARWPDDAQWQLLKQANVLAELTPPISMSPADGVLAFDFTLPMPGISCLELTPEDPAGDG
jgi:xylan 1,4-beta-xylosidase